MHFRSMVTALHMKQTIIGANLQTACKYVFSFNFLLYHHSQEKCFKTYKYKAFFPVDVYTHTHFFFLFSYLNLVLNILNEQPITVLCPIIVLLYTYYSNHCFLEHTAKSSSITFETRKLRDCMKVKSCRTDKILRFGRRTSLQTYLIFYSLKLNK